MIIVYFFVQITMENIKIFEGIAEEDVKEILKHCEIEIFLKGQHIMTQWEESNGKGYIIKQGNVDVVRNGENIARLSEWEVFWEIALLSEEERTATIKAITDVETYVIEQVTLIEVVNNYSNSLNKEIISRIEMNMMLEK